MPEISTMLDFRNTAIENINAVLMSLKQNDIIINEDFELFAEEVKPTNNGITYAVTFRNQDNVALATILPAGNILVSIY